MRKLRDQSFELDLENALHVVSFDDVPRITAARLGHRHQQVFIEVGADTDRRGADAVLKQTHRLRHDLVSVRDADVRESVSDKHNAIDPLIEHPLADSQTTTHPCFVQSRRTASSDT